MKTLADRIKTNREKQGLTQIELAKLVGLDQTVISKLERGVMFETTKIAELANALKVDAYWLATGKGSPENRQAQEFVRDFNMLDEEYQKLISAQVKGFLKATKKD